MIFYIYLAYNDLMIKYLALSIGGDNGDTATVVTLPGPIDKLTNAPDILQRIIRTGFVLAIFIASLLVLFYTLYQAYRWTTSQGDKKEIEAASGAFWHGILGLIIILTSFIIINLIGYFFQIDFFHFTLK